MNGKNTLVLLVSMCMSFAMSAQIVNPQLGDVQNLVLTLNEDRIEKIRRYNYDPQRPYSYAYSGRVSNDQATLRLREGEDFLHMRVVLHAQSSQDAVFRFGVGGVDADGNYEIAKFYDVNNNRMYYTFSDFVELNADTDVIDFYYDDDAKAYQMWHNDIPVVCGALNISGIRQLFVTADDGDNVNRLVYISLDPEIDQLLPCNPGCPTTSLFMNSQADIDNFPTDYPGCTALPVGVNLTINDAIPNEITNLDGLNQLISIGGNVLIEDNQALTNLDGLSQLSSVGGSFTIWDNDALTNVDGLSQLSSIGEDMRITFNNALMNLDGLSQLSSVESISIHSNGSLTSIDGLSQIPSSLVGSLEIGFNNLLTNLDALSHLSEIGGTLRIYYNDALTNIDGLNQISSVGESLIILHLPLTNLGGLSQISTVGGYLSLEGNDALTSLDGLSQISSVGGIYIAYNDALTNVDALNSISSLDERLMIFNNNALMNLDGLANLSSIAGTPIGIHITGNSQLSECCILCPLFAADAIDPSVIEGSVTIGSNDTGCDSQAEIEACTPCVACAADLTLNTSQMGNLNYTASNSITSTDTIADGEDVLYDAGNLIQLQGGFSAAATANFSAVIGDGCQ